MENVMLVGAAALAVMARGAVGAPTAA